ncbi:MAG: gliding motility-associated C-terminal domain-containing protein [Chitinophagaceae bacterium]|nr:gliding motility-associated C-terminal domain-containing protein [Chitinophagaceae bacterium]
MKHFFLTTFLIFCFGNIFSQSPQDCRGAIPICQTVYHQNNAYSGVGTLNELNAGNQGCLSTGENNSVWYIFTANTSGTLVFTLTPNVVSDYDFAIWDLTDISCSEISGQLPIRCNFASLANSDPGGLTGLSTLILQPAIGAGGGSFSSAISATAGQTFVMLVNNASGNAAGYTIDFSLSTCQIADNQHATFKSITLPVGCNAPNTLTALLSENIKCNTFVPNGSDFSLTPANATITSAVASSCVAGGAFANKIIINFSNSLPAGNYTLALKNGTDGNTLSDNCTNFSPVGTSINFTVLPALGINIAASFGCSGVPSGTITATNIGGTAPFQYKLNAGAWGANNYFTGLAAGAYTISIKDVNGCQKDTVVSLVPASQISINSIAVSNPTCYGQNNGTATVNASGGAAPLFYAAGMQAFQAGNTLTGLGPGNYVITVKDANGCTKTSLIFLSSPGQILVNTLNITSPLCGANNGSISLSAYGGTPPLNYALNAGPYQLSGNFNGLAAGSYTIHIKDGNNCIKDTVLNVVPQNGATITSLAIVQPSCVGNSGSITVNATGGATPYLYSKDGMNFQASNIFTPLVSGSYTITLKDANGCTATSATVLTSPANLFFTNNNVVMPTCITLGSITVNGLGGAPPYTYAINAGAYSPTNNFTSLAAGQYTLHVRDNNNCVHDTIITLSITQIPIINISNIVNPTCSFPNTGSITASASGAVAPYTYAINAGAFGASGNFTNLGAGVYTITAKDANGCTSSTTVTLTANNTLGFTSFTKTNVGCGGTPLGSIQAVAGNGNPSYSYNINGGPFGGVGNFNNLAAGTYTVIAKDASNCTVSSVVVISSSAVVTINSLSWTNSTCYSPGNGTVTIVGTVSAPPINYFYNYLIPSPSGNFNGLSAGVCTISVYDANGCHKDTVITITSPPPMYFTNVNIVLPPCYGGVGSIDVLGSGGVPGFTYALNGGAYSPQHTWSNLNAGTYTVHLKDANSCIKDTVFFLQEPPQIQFTNVNYAHASCNGSPTGSISMSASGGVPPIQFSINGGAFGPNANYTNLAAGSYTIIAKDANNCTKQMIITLTNNGNFYVSSINKTLPNCFGDMNGSININVSGGVPAYAYGINGGGVGANNTFNGLASGYYTIHVQDNSGCAIDTVVFLPQPVQVGFSNIALTPTLCFGTNTGTATVQGGGGTPAYQFKIDGGAFGNGNTFNNLAPGNHTISVKDSKGCIVDTVITITQPLPIHFANVTIVSPGCIGNTGIISVGANGGVAPHTFAINGGAFVANGAFGNLPIGIYTITIKDDNGCTADTIITLSNATVIVLNALTFTPAICPNANSAFISANATSPYPPLMYSLNGGAPQAGGFFGGLGAGTHLLHIEDQMGCYLDTNVTIVSAPPILITGLIATPPLCFNTTDGSIVVNASGGLGPKMYSVDALPFSLNNTITNLGAGTYTVHVKDSVGCQVDTTIQIVGPTPIVMTNIVKGLPFCNIATNGSLTITAGGGQGPYQYAINYSLFNTNNVFSNLVAGNYTIQIMDINGCILDTMVNLPSANYMNFITLGINQVSCKFGNDASINMGVIGGLSPYSYSINAVPNGASGLFQNLSVGSYTIQVTDNIGCQEDTIINITEPLLPLSAVVLSTSPNSCKGDSVGSMTASASGGTAPYTYSLDGVNFQASAVFNGLQSGSHTLTVKDNKGCLSDTTFMITEPNNSILIQIVSVVGISCQDVNDGAIEVSSIYGIPPFSYYLNGVNKGIDTLYQNLSPGEYVIEVKDSIGCISSGKLNIAPSTKKPTIIVDSIHGILCAGDKTGSIAWHSIDCFPPYSYRINGNSIGFSNSIDQITNGQYFIQVLDSIGCYNDTTVSIDPANPIEINVLATPASCNGRGDDGKATASVIGGVAPFHYQWSGANTNSVDAYNLKYGLQWAYVKDDLGCVDSTEFEIKYDPCCHVILPNAFTPNGDGNNDIFRILKYGDVQMISLEVYNRFGQQVFKTKNMDEGWDGRFNGQLADLATYFYLVKYKCPLNDEVQILRGDVILIR